MKLNTPISLVFMSIMTFSLVLSCRVSAASTMNDKSFTIYLVRHAEKAVNQKNPPLTSCGINRSKQLAVILEQADVKTIYSTRTQRTEQTAAPLATQQHIAVTHYSASDLAAFSKQLITAGENALVVGHSNTTPQLAALVAKRPVKEITEAEYQMLYQIHFQGSVATLTRLKQPLTCQ